MNRFYLSFVCLFLASAVCQSQGSIAQLTSENMAFFTISVDGVRIASDASIMQEITGLKEGGQYNVYIDYVSPEFSDVRAMLRLDANGGRGAGHYSFTIPSFFQNELRLESFVPMSPSGMGAGGIDQMSMNMNVGQTSMNVSMNTNAGQMGMGMGQQQQHQQPTMSQPAQQPQTSVQPPAQPVQTQIVYVEGYSGQIGCEKPVSADRFQRMMARIEDASFSDDKVNVAKQILRTNCLVIEQLVAMLEEVAFDEGQLDLAKFAYDHIYDLENYFEVYGVFSFSSSNDELDEFLQNKY
ncbi:MAG: DUF4476 domain-containing protein [Crocinitomicaceae bacterium]|jgi:hypothetical protein|nr:DUF4476 domain-containing protein [Crocinitomicaceae bacterium]